MVERVADLTVDELRALIRETVREVLSELDDEQDLEFTPEFAERLRAYIQEKPQGRPLDEVARELGFDE